MWLIHHIAPFAQTGIDRQLLDPPYCNTAIISCDPPQESILGSSGRNTMPQPSPPGVAMKRETLRSIALKDRGAAAITEARETIAHADETIARTKWVLQKTEETFQHLRARRGREAERQHPLFQL